MSENGVERPCERKKRSFPWLAALGLALLAAGWIGLSMGPEMSQYVFLPGEADYAAGLSDVESRWGDSFSSASLHAVAGEVSLTAGDRSQGEVALREVAGGYFEIYPRRITAGRALTRGDGTERVIVLDEKLAFQLFRDQDPLGKTVDLNGKEYRVEGVAAYSRRPGDTGLYQAWIPLGTEDAPEKKIMVLSAAGRGSAALRTVFETAANEVFGEGQAIFPGKERSRGLILPQVMILIFCVWLGRIWVRVLVRRIGVRVSELREISKSRYLHQMLGPLCGRVLLILLGIGATVAAFAGLVVWAAGPMRIFPEWVPENMVSADAVAQRFWDLNALFSSPIQFRTPELAEIRLWSGLCRWGSALTALGMALHLAGKLRKKKENLAQEA